MNVSQINEIVYEDDEIDLESSQESENEDDENEPIRALIQYRIMYEKRMGSCLMIFEMVLFLFSKCVRGLICMDIAIRQFFCHANPC